MTTIDTTQQGIVLLDILAADAQFDRTILERLGHPVVTCEGPAVATTCPLLGGEGCAKFETSHGIVFELDLDRPQHRAILRRYGQVTAPDVPIRAVVQPGQRARYAELIDGFEVWEQEPTVADLDGFAAEVEAVDRSRP
jgi:hypothetical protein